MALLAPSLEVALKCIRSSITRYGKGALKIESECVDDATKAELLAEQDGLRVSLVRANGQRKTLTFERRGIDYELRLHDGETVVVSHPITRDELLQLFVTGESIFMQSKDMKIAVEGNFFSVQDGNPEEKCYFELSEILAIELIRAFHS